MDRIGEAKEILRTLGLPPAQQNEIAALTFLALCGVGAKSKWKEAKRTSLTISKKIMKFIENEFGRSYAPNTRETFRRQVLHQFVQAGVADYNPDDPALPTNHPQSHYAISKDALAVARAYGTVRWESDRKRFAARNALLSDLYRSKRPRQLVPVRLPDGTSVRMSPGKHNQVQAAVVEQFAAHFAPGSSLLYLGDTAKKDLVVDRESLLALGIPITRHGKLPDIVLYDRARGWIFLVEAVTSHGPMTPKRVRELVRMFAKCSVGLVFVSAFPDFAQFRRHLRQVAWETEVWIAEIPDHLIHFNGDRFLGPR